MHISTKKALENLSKTVKVLRFLSIPNEQVTKVYLLSFQGLFVPSSLPIHSFFFFFFFFFFNLAHGMGKFPGQRLNLHYIRDLAAEVTMPDPLPGSHQETPIHSF